MPTANVELHEVLYRQIKPGGDPIYYDPDRMPPVHQSRFLPTREDGDGLSLIRSRFRTEIWSAHRLEQPTVRFRLAQVTTEAMRQVGSEVGLLDLSYQPTEDALDLRFGEPWAHCVVIEINRASYDSDTEAKKRIKNWAMGIAKLVTNEDVIGPFREPSDKDPYRPNRM